MKRSRILTADEALSRAAGMCARSEQCTPDLLKKMTTWGLSNSDSHKVLNRLKQLNFVDDVRFAKAYAHDKLAYSGWGRNKILQGLWAKRLAKETIELSMEEIDDEEYKSVAERVIRTKIRLSKDGITTYEAKLKVLRFAMQRGFEARLASSIINRIALEQTRANDDQT